MTLILLFILCTLGTLSTAHIQVRLQYFAQGNLHMFTRGAQDCIFGLACSGIYTSRLFWLELTQFGDVGYRDISLLLKTTIME